MVGEILFEHITNLVQPRFMNQPIPTDEQSVAYCEPATSTLTQCYDTRKAFPWPLCINDVEMMSVSGVKHPIDGASQRGQISQVELGNGNVQIVCCQNKNIYFQKLLFCFTFGFSPHYDGHLRNLNFKLLAKMPLCTHQLESGRYSMPMIEVF